jgi:hypothetical protein
LPETLHWWWRIVTGEEGFPQGVSMSRDATFVKPGRSWRPVPPMTAIRTWSIVSELVIRLPDAVVENQLTLVFTG